MIWPFENDTGAIVRKLAKRKILIPFLQMGLFLSVLPGMAVILSVWMVSREKKQSLVEQMRTME